VVFVILWLAELLSFIGSSMTNFALGVWVFQLTGSALNFSMITMLIILPNILAAPLAGALVDRWNRRRTMVTSKAGAAVCIIWLVLILSTGDLHLWSIFVAVALGSTFTTFGWLAYLATVSQLVPHHNISRANGMLQAGYAIGQIASPAIAGALLALVTIKAILLIDLATFVLAGIVLVSIRIPEIVREENNCRQKSLWQEALQGWKYIAVRAGLLALLIHSFVINFAKGVILILFAPLVLSFSTPKALGFILSTGGGGMLFGSLLVSIWKGPKSRILVVLIAALFQGGTLCLGGAQPNVGLAAVAAFLYLFAFPVINGYSHAIWQSQVDPQVQGRVFALKNMVALSSAPLAFLITGLATERVFEPLMAPDGLLSESVGKIIGTGAGRGAALVFTLTGIFLIISTGVALFYAPLRKVENDGVA
jgi:DHA3 family macrolide efflux protein-like MFS transporter